MATGTRWKVNANAKTTTKARIRSVADTSGGSSTVLYETTNGASLYLISETVGADNYYWYYCSNNDLSSKPKGYIRCDLISGTKETGGSTGGGTGGGTGVNTASWADVLSNKGVYKKESSGSAVCTGVKTLQQLLKAIGYGAENVGTIAEDGNFGAITEDAVKKFQYECGLTQDGVVGQATATKLRDVQGTTWFTKREYYPVKASLMTFSNFPNMGTDEKTQRSIVVRAISAEHGYPGSTSAGHKDARIGVAKVLKNRTNPSVNVNRGKSGDYSFKSVYLSQDYTSKNQLQACYLPRGYSAAMQHMHDAATSVVAGNWPSGASKVGTTHIFQKGSSMNSTGAYNNRPGFCRYPETGSSYTFFHIS